MWAKNETCFEEQWTNDPEETGLLREKHFLQLTFLTPGVTLTPGCSVHTWHRTVNELSVSEPWEPADNSSHLPRQTVVEQVLATRGNLLLTIVQQDATLDRELTHLSV